MRYVYPSLLRLGIGVCIVGTVVPAGLTGCSGPGGHRFPPPDAAGSPGPGVDTTKAYLPLSRIAPVPSAPKRPESLPALSARSENEIEKADALIEEQRYTEAAIELQKALRYDPQHPDIYRTLAQLHWEAGNAERARTNASKALELNPDDAATHYVMGRCHLAGGDRQGALTAFRTAMLCSNFIGTVKVSALCHYYLADVLASEGYLEAAIAEYDAFDGAAAAEDLTRASAELRTLLRGKTSPTADARARILESLGRFGPAADALAPLANERHNDFPLNLRYAGLLTRAGRLEEARTVAERIPPDQPGVFELLTDIHERAGQPDRVLNDLRRMVADHPTRYQLVLSLADALIRFGRPEEARRELQSSLIENPANSVIRTKLMDLLIAESQWLAALQVAADGVEQPSPEPSAFESKIVALASHPQAVEELLARDTSPGFGATYLRGVLAQAVGRNELAEQLFRAAHDANRDFVSAQAALGRLYLTQYKYEDALRVVARKDGAVARDARLEMILGRIHQRLDEANTAELHLKAALQLDRTNLEAMYALGELYRRSGQILRAQRQLRVLLEQDPNHERAMELLATTYLDEHKRDIALEQYEALVKITKNPRTKARCEALLEQARKPQPDVDAYRGALLEVIEQHGADASLWQAIAESYGEEELEKKRDAYQKSHELDADNEEAAGALAELSVRMLDFEQALVRFRELLHRRPNRYPWMLAVNERNVPGLIELYWLTQQYDAALELARSAEARTTKDDTWKRRFRLAIVETLRLSGRPEEALAMLKGWADEAPDDRSWSATLAVEYERQERPADALPVWTALHQAHPSDKETLRDLIRALMNAKRFDRAAQYVLDWLDDDPENDVALRWLVALLADAERFDDGLEVVRNRLFYTLAREEFQRLEIQLLTRANRHRESLDLIDALLDETTEVLRRVVQGREEPTEKALPPERITRLPNEPFRIDKLQEHIQELRLLHIGVMIDAGQYRQAEDELQGWLDQAVSPEERIGILFQLAQCRRAQGHEAGATEHLARALSLRPADVRLNNDVAYGWIDLGVRLEESERMIRYSLSRAPRQAAYLDTYGWLLYKKGAFAEAEKWLSRARATRVNDPVVFDHLGDACWRLGRREEAIQHWETAAQAEKKRPADRVVSGDEQRVREQTPKKIEDAKAGGEPAVAPVAETP